MSSRLVKLVGVRFVLVCGTLTSAAAFASIALWHDTTWQVLAATTLQGVGNGLVFSTLAAVVIAAVPPSRLASRAG